MKKKIESMLKKYFSITKKALIEAKKALNKEKIKQASIVLDMAQRYYEDAKWFEKKCDLIRALVAVSYAHGWLDCGAKLGLFKVKNNQLFTIP